MSFRFIISVGPLSAVPRFGVASLMVLTGLSLMASIPAPVFAQVTGVEGRERLKDISGWDELCAITDCSQFPIGYSTYAFGPEVYYFPDYGTLTAEPLNTLIGGVRPGRFAERGEDGELLRSFSNSSGLIVSYCCHYLLEFYGLAEGFPVLLEGRDGNRMPPARMIVSPHDRPASRNKVSVFFEVTSAEPPPISAVIPDDQLSYNDDFWLLAVGEPNDKGMRGFRLLSKRPLLNGRHVYSRCATSCDFSTLSFAEGPKNTLPHVSVLRVNLTRENMFLCTPEELGDGCDPAPDVFNRVPRMLELIDDMFEAAQVFPEDVVR